MSSCNLSFSPLGPFFQYLSLLGGAPWPTTSPSLQAPSAFLFSSGFFHTVPHPQPHLHPHLNKTKQKPENMFCPEGCLLPLAGGGGGAGVTGASLRTYWSARDVCGSLSVILVRRALSLAISLHCTVTSQGSQSLTCPANAGPSALCPWLGPSAPGSDSASPSDPEERIMWTVLVSGQHWRTGAIGYIQFCYNTAGTCLVLFNHFFAHTLVLFLCW